MNLITQALRSAGIVTPTQSHRIWMWLNDHQPQSAKQTSQALSLPQAPTLLSQMEKRGMVSSTVEHNRSNGQDYKMYRVVGKEYVLLPLPFKPVVAKPVAPVFALQFQPTEPVQCSQAGPTAFDLDSLTIAEARALYKRLASMFQGEPA